MKTITLLLAAFLTAGETTEQTTAEAPANVPAPEESSASTSKTPESLPEKQESETGVFRFQVAENSPAGTVVGKVPQQQPQNQRQDTFTITAGNKAGTFTIDPTTGRISIAQGAKLDYERQSRFEIDVAVVEAAGITDSLKEGFAEELLKSGIDVRKLTTEKRNKDELTVTIQLIDVNEPPVIVDQSFSIPENSDSGTIVGRVIATDPDLHDALSFSMTDGDASEMFKIDPASGLISVGDEAVLDFESQPSLQLLVTVTDAEGLAKSAKIDLTLSDVNEPPQIVTESWSLPENSENGTILGQVHALDADADDQLTFQIVGGNSDDTFALDSTTGELTVRDHSLLDFETTGEWLLQIQVTDAHDVSTAQEFRIAVTDADDPPLVSNQSFRLPTETRNGMTFGRFSAIDLDADDALSFAITGGDKNQTFSIDPKTGEIALTDSAKLESWSEDKASLEITVTDRAGVSSTAQANIDLRDALAAGRLAKKNLASSGTENSNNGPHSAETNNLTNSTAQKQSGLFTQSGGWLAAAGMGVFFVVTTLLRNRNLTRRRKSLKALEREREQVRDCQQELEDYSNELGAEKDELIAVQNLLTHEFEKLRGLLGRHRDELNSTTTSLHEGEALLKIMAVGKADGEIQTVAVDSEQEKLNDSLRTLREGLNFQQRRLETLQDVLERRDQELGETCASMDARLKEMLQRGATLELSSGTDSDIAMPQSRDIFATEQEPQATAEEWDHRQGVVDDLEQQFSDSHVEVDAEKQSTEITDGAVMNELAETIADEPNQQTGWQTARTELDTLRQVANKSARSALAQHSRKQMWRSKYLLGALTITSSIAAVLLLSGHFWTDTSALACGWGAAAIGATSAVHLIQKIMQSH